MARVEAVGVAERVGVGRVGASEEAVAREFGGDLIGCDWGVEFHDAPVGGYDFDHRLVMMMI